jgi:hypothetical protein
VALLGAMKERVNKLRVVTYLPAPVFKRLNSYNRHTGLSRSEFVERIIAEYCELPKPKNEPPPSAAKGE